MTTTVTIGFWEFVLGLAGVVVVMAIIVWAFGLMLIESFKEHLELRFQLRDKTLTKLDSEVHELKGDLRDLRVLLPNEYVRREDWIRFSGTLDAKLDRINEKGEATGRLMASIAARLKVKTGDEDAG